MFMLVLLYLGMLGTMALLYLHMLGVVDTLDLVFIADILLWLYYMELVIQIGPLALLFETTYAVRGGNSGTGITSGVFSVNFYYSYSGGYWYLDAVILTYAIRGGYTSDSAHCGIFYVLVYTVASYSYWYFGAATYAIRGGYSGCGLDNGIFYVRFMNSPSTALWYFGAVKKIKELDFQLFLYLF